VDGLGRQLAAVRQEQLSGATPAAEPSATSAPSAGGWPPAALKIHPPRWESRGGVKHAAMLPFWARPFPLPARGGNVIATLKVLGLRARDVGTVVAAARNVVDYVHGTGPEACAAAGRAAYYSDGPRVQGRARGRTAALVGLSAGVTREQLESVLSGRHPVTGRWLVPAAGSAGRTRPRTTILADGPGPFTLAAAARAAGVSPAYLRRLVEGHEVSRSSPPTPDAEAAEGLPLGMPVGRERLRLAAEKDAAGRWVVTRAELQRFVAAREPPTVVMGFDLTCSAPKSLSLLWAFGDDDLRADVAAALDAGVDAALAYLEQHAAVGTVAGRNRLGMGLAAACYRHEVSRADEPHLHVHNVIVNAVPVPLLDADGQPQLDERGVAQVVWRTLDSEVLHRQVKTAGYLGAAALRRGLSLRRGLEWGPVRNGVAELTGFPRPLLEAFSTRSRQIHAEFARLTPTGVQPDPAALADAQRRTRKARRVLADDEVRAIQRERLAAAGWTPEQVRRLGGPVDRRPAPPAEEEIAALVDRLTGPRGLTEHHPSFGPREAVQAVAGWAVDRLDPAAIDAVAGRLLADPRLVLISTAGPRRRSLPEPTYTTTELLAVEHDLLQTYDQGLNKAPIPVAAHQVETALVAASTVLQTDAADPAARLSDEQANVVRRLLSSPDRVRLVVGPAGSGKTEMLRAATAALTAAGHRVFATANGGRQAEQLHQRLGVPTQVVTGWLTLFGHTDPAGVWPPGSVLLIDEATQVATRDAHRLLDYATATDTVVIAIGDPAQLGAVGAGGWFTRLAAGPRTLALGQVHRQPGPDLAAVRAVLDALRSPDGEQARRALDRLAADGRLRVLDDRPELLAAVITDWYADRRTGRGGPMLAERTGDTGLLNAAARTLLQADGTLRGPGLRMAGRAFQEGDQVITLTQAGHTLIPAGGRAREYIRTGTIGTVTAVHPDQQALTVTFPGKGPVHIGADYLTFRFGDGRDGGLAHAYAITAHKAEGATLPTARTLAVDDTSRAGLYVMLSRARHDLRAYLTRRASLAEDPTAETWLPVLTDHHDPLDRLAGHLTHSEPEPLATDHDPAAVAAHHLRTAAPSPT